MNEPHKTNLKGILEEVETALKNNPTNITDRQIAKISIEWYERDWDTKNGHNIEGLGFSRGVLAGMTLLRNLIEKSNKTNTP